MLVSHVEILVEEPSAEAMLRILLPKILAGPTFEVYLFQGKTDLLQKLPQRLRGYAEWLPDDWRIVVLVDRDDDDCVDLKNRLEDIASKAGFATRTAPRDGRFAVVNRLAIEELEAWYFGDWQAVRQAYPRVNAHVASKSLYRAPDDIKGGTWEAFERLLKRAGYFQAGLRKIEAARAVASHLEPSRNTSPSFCTFRNALAEMSAT